jgi:nitroimidazol reductase NimA-like FMN-containing flavoprotein (pyridoxamine 5'-phosphate oxidase superfamily)
VPDSMSPDTRLRRHPERGREGFEPLAAVLDAGLICHLGLEIDGWPTVVPTLYGRVGDRLFLHGSVASRALRTAKGGVPVCVTVSIVDGIVLARSVFNHSMNYRSAMVFGEAAPVEGEEKVEGLRAIVEHVAPGQWGYARLPTDRELAQTSVLRIGLGQASVKVRSGPPGDGGEPDSELGLWAGELPLRLAALEPVPDRCGPVGPLPEHLAALGERLVSRLAP